MRETAKQFALREASFIIRAIGVEGRWPLLLYLLKPTEQSLAALVRVSGESNIRTALRLSNLEGSGLVISRREGQERYYSLRSERVRRLLEAVNDFCRRGARRRPRRSRRKPTGKPSRQ